MTISGPKCNRGNPEKYVKRIEFRSSSNVPVVKSALYQYLHGGTPNQGPVFPIASVDTGYDSADPTSVFGKVQVLPDHFSIESDFDLDGTKAMYGPWALYKTNAGQLNNLFSIWPQEYRTNPTNAQYMTCDGREMEYDHTNNNPYRLSMCFKTGSVPPGPPPAPPSPPPAATSPPPSPPTPPLAPTSVPASCYKPCERDDYPPYPGRDDFCASIYPYVNWAFQLNGTNDRQPGDIGNHRASTCEGAHNFTQDYKNNGNVTCDCGECFEHKGCTKAGGATQDPHLHFPNGGEADLRGRDGAHPPPFGDTRGEA